MRVNGEKIKKMREERNITGVELAKLVGYSARHCIYHVERGDTMPAADKLARIAFELDCMSEDLLIAEEGDYN